MRLLVVLSIALCGLACAASPADEVDAATTRPNAGRTGNGVLRDPVGDTFDIEGTVRGQTTVR